MMPFMIVRNDITKMCVDAIVNTANPRPVIGAGTDSRIHEVAGPELLKVRQIIGSIDTGHAVITPAFHLNAAYVIHTVGPVWVDAIMTRRGFCEAVMRIL
jgi:O-acetyl-ADP-ribose deacetylase (regulator of RNase III)